MWRLVGFRSKHSHHKFLSENHSSREEAIVRKKELDLKYPQADFIYYKARERLTEFHHLENVDGLSTHALEATFSTTPNIEMMPTASG